MEKITNGARPAAELAGASPEDQGGVAELGLGVPGTDVEIGGGSPVPGP